MHLMPSARGKAIAVMAAVVTALSFGRVLPASAATAAATSDLHAVIAATGTISTPPDIYHALRVSSSGAWKGFNGLTGYVPGMPNGVNGVAIAGTNGELHVLVTNVRGTEASLLHALRSADGRWKGFNNVSGPASVPASMSPYPAVAAAIVNGDLHVLLLISGPTPTLYHAIRYASTGAWAGFNPVTASIPGNIASVAAASVGGNLHVLIAMATGGGLYHAIRYSSNGAWNGFNNVAGPATVPGPSVTAVAAAAVGQDLQVLIKTSTEVLYHGMRISADGSWKGFNDVSSAARVPSGVTFPSIAAAGVNGDLQILVNTNTGTLYHALRSSATGAWNGFNDVSCCATVPSAITVVATAGSQ